MRNPKPRNPPQGNTTHEKTSRPLTWAELADYLAMRASGSTPKVNADEEAAAKREILANLGVTAAAAGAARSPEIPQEQPVFGPALTRAELADYMDRAGWNPVKARELAAAERAVDFGYALTSKHLEGLADLIESAPEAERATLQLHTVDLLGRWLLRKGQAVGPDGRIIVGIRTLGEAKKIVAGWISDEFARQKNKNIQSHETKARIQEPRDQGPQVSAAVTEISIKPDSIDLKEPGNAPLSAPSHTSKVEVEGGWAEIEIMFLSDERVQIRNKKSIETRNYAEFGFQDGRNQTPNRAWETLRRLAELRGIIGDGTQGRLPWPKVEKRVQEIRRVFRRHFGISSDPVPFVEGTGYRARFKISCGPSYHT